MTTPLLALLLAAPQDLTAEWIDRITHDTVPARGPLEPRPFPHALWMGVLAAYDTNVNLEETGEDDETVLVPFLRVRVDVQERQVDAAIDVLAHWKQYVPDSEFSDDEERVYGRIRYVSPKLQLEAFEIFQHASDPVDVVFADRVDRFVSQTYGRARWEPSTAFALEGDVDLGIVRFQEDGFDDGDNWNLRAGLAASARLTAALEAVARAGPLVIDYRYSTGAPPDADGFWARAGVQGDLLPQLSLTFLVGAVTAESDDFSDGSAGEEEDAGEAAVHLRWQATETVALYADYARLLTFAAGQEPWAVVNRTLLLAEVDATADVRLRGRLQFDHADGALGSERDYATAAASVRWKTHPQVFFDVGGLYRWGDAAQDGADTEYDGVVLHVGMIITN